MDIDLPHHSVAGVNESMRCIRGNDNDAACLHLAFFISDGDRGGSFDGERDFYVGMLVQRRALPGFGRDDVGREGRAFFFADELMRHSDKRQLLEIEEAHLSASTELANRSRSQKSEIRPCLNTVGRKRRPIYSERNACTGSTSAARRAGKRQAISAVAVSNTAAPPRSTGLCAET